MSSGDIESKLIDALYRGACDPAEFERALNLMSELFDGCSVVLGEVDIASPKVGLVIGISALARELLDAYPKFAHLDPFPALLARTQKGTVLCSSRQFSARERDRMPFVNEYLRPFDREEAMGCALSINAAISSVVGVQRGVHRPEFNDDEVGQMERLVPHVTRALQLRQLFIASQERGQLMTAILDRSKAGIIAVRSDLSSLFVNKTARDIASARDGMGLSRSGQIVVADTHASKRLAGLTAAVLGGGAGGIVRVPRPSAKLPYVVLVSPLPAEIDLFSSARHGVLFAIHDPSRMSVSTNQQISNLLHISPSAAKLVHAMLEGEDLKHYADRAEISMNTVRFHLKTAFACTGTRSQSGLVRRALLALNDLGPYFPGDN